MMINRFKAIVSGALTAATVLSTIPAVNVSAAEPACPEIDVINRYELDLFTYGPELLCDNIPGLDRSSPLQIEVVKDYYLDGNYTQYDQSTEIHYNSDNSVNYSYENEYDPATGKKCKQTYRSSNYSYYTTYEYDSSGHMIRQNSYAADNHLNGYSTYQYDARGNTTRYEWHLADGTLSSYADYEHEYWDNGNRKRYCYRFYTKVDGEFTETSRYYYESNEAGWTISSADYSYDYTNKILNEYSRNEYILTRNQYGSYTQERCNHYTNGELDYYSTFGSRQIDDDTWESDTYYWNLDNSAKSKTCYIYKKFGTPSYYQSETINYDKDGNVESRTVYERDGARVLKQTNYDGNGNKTSWTVYEYIQNEFYDNGHYVPDFDAYVAPENCVFQYRLYNPNSGEHFYSGSRDEVRNLAEAGWNFEGSGFITPNTGAPIYRLYSEEHGDHFYTTGEAEKDALVTQGWTLEGIAFPSADASTGRPMYRLNNPNAYPNGESGAHHFTMSEQEKDNLVAAGWVYEGIAWYSV